MNIFLKMGKIPVGLALLLVLLSFEKAFSQTDLLSRLCGKNWYGLYMQGSKIGYLSTELENTTGVKGIWKMGQSAVIISQLEGRDFSMSISDFRYYSAPDYAIDSSIMLITSPTGDIEVEGRQIDKSHFALTTKIAGSETEKKLNYIPDYLDSLLYLETKIASSGVSAGDSFNLLYFEPTPPVQKSIHIAVKIEAIESRILNGVPTRIFVINTFNPEMNFEAISKCDESGLLLEGSFGAGLTCRLESEESARRIDATTDILSSSLVKTEGKIGDPQDLKSLKVKLTGVKKGDILESANQAVAFIDTGAAIITVTRRESRLYSQNIPIRSSEFSEYLSADALTQADNPEIGKTARGIIDGTKNGYEAACKINQWVYANVEKEFSAEFSNALTTFKTRKGDCGEHAVLTVALMRAVGIPARELSGLIYWPPGNGFGYHAWVEAYVGEWVQLDPSWGEDIPNPAHIALAGGDALNQWGVVARLVGNIKIEIIESQ